jgi:nucleotide-binding universal stress UspA family protein
VATPLFVVPVDFAPGMEDTVAAAFVLAKRCGARVHLLEVVSPRVSRTSDTGTVRRRQRRSTSTSGWFRLDDSIQAAERSGIQVRLVAYRGDAIKVIASYAQLTNARLLVIDTNYGTPRWRRHPRVVGALSRTIATPLLALPAGANPSLSFGHLVSAVDFTVASAVALRTVLTLIRRRRARLTLVHAMTHAPHHLVFSGGEALRVTRHLRRHAAQVADHFRRKLPARMTLRVDARVTTGAPYRGILEVASEVGADLIVMGIPPRSRIDTLLFGSTLQRVLRSTPTPVLAFPVRAGAYKWLDEADGVEIARPGVSTFPSRPDRR